MSDIKQAVREQVIAEFMDGQGDDLTDEGAPDAVGLDHDKSVFVSHRGRNLALGVVVEIEQVEVAAVAIALVLVFFSEVVVPTGWWRPHIG